MWPAVFNCSSSSIPVTTWCVCMYYAMYCGGALIKNHGPCSGRAGHAADGPSAAARATAPTQVTTVSRSYWFLGNPCFCKQWFLALLTSKVKDKCVTTTMGTLLPFWLCMEVAVARWCPHPHLVLTSRLLPTMFWWAAALWSLGHCPAQDEMVKCGEMFVYMLTPGEVTSHLGHSE